MRIFPGVDTQTLGGIYFTEKMLSWKNVIQEETLAILSALRNRLVSSGRKGKQAEETGEWRESKPCVLSPGSCP